MNAVPRRLRRKPKPKPFPLVELLKSHKVSKRQLARATGIARPMICRLVKRNANPTWLTIQRIAHALGCSLGDFGKGGAA